MIDSHLVEYKHVGNFVRRDYISLVERRGGHLVSSSCNKQKYGATAAGVATCSGEEFDAASKHHSCSLWSLLFSQVRGFEGLQHSNTTIDDVLAEGRAL